MVNQSSLREAFSLIVENAYGGMVGHKQKPPWG